MMKLIHPNYVRSEDFEVETIDRNIIRYRENSKEILLQREAGWDPEHYTAIYLSTISEWHIPKNKIIDNIDKIKISDNLQKAFAFMNARLKIE